MTTVGVADLIARLVSVTNPRMPWLLKLTSQGAVTWYGPLLTGWLAGWLVLTDLLGRRQYQSL